MNRRNFLKIAGGGIAALASATLGKMVVHKIFSRKRQQWIRAGAVSQFVPGKPEKATLQETARGGRNTFSAWVIKKNEHEIIAFDPLCTHIECEYEWKNEKKQFFCPCHDGWFDMEGNVLAGPPPRALYRYETKVENGTLYILMDTA